jgi:uncharacterized protein YcaQ
MALNAQFLDGAMELPEGKEGVAGIIEKLGYIQIDTIAVIERAHHHTLWTRRSDYSPEMLHELQARDRRVFEYWGHAMSYLPMSDYRFCLPKMRNFNNPTSRWAKERLEKYGHLTGSVLERIREEGPLGSKDFEPPPGKKPGTWWDWKPAKAALELLFWKGELMITERRNFHKVYDLAERVLPEGIDTSYPADDELGRFLVHRALSAYGVANRREIRGFMHPVAARDSHIQAVGRDVIAESLDTLLEKGDVVPVEIESQKGMEYFALSSTLDQPPRRRSGSRSLFLLSPFDNLIIQRERARSLFGFDYKLECYTPVAKRKYGYFTLPILWGDSLIGRVDPKADRKKKTLIIRNLVFESGFDAFDEFFPVFAGKLGDLAIFNNCTNVKIEKISPSGLKTTLKRIVRELDLEEKLE